jgi:uncharacterized membrane protein
MVVFTNSITIDKPLSEVFAFVSDQRNNPKWNYYVTQVEKINDAEKEGAEYLQIRKSDRQKIGVVRYRLNEHIVIQTLPRERPKVRREMIFKGDEKSTTIHDQIGFKMPLPGFLAKLFLKGPQKAVKQNLEKLKVLLEKGQTRYDNSGN